MGNEEKVENQNLLSFEFQECVSHSRFVVGIRFTYFVSFTSFFFVIIGAFHYVWVSEPRMFGELKPWLLLISSTFGSFVLAIAWFIEKRGAQISKAFDVRSATLEKAMGIENGIRQKLVDPKQKPRFLGIPISHTLTISIFYGGIALVWFILIGYSGYLLWTS